MKRLVRSALLPALLLLASPSAVWACAACFGKSDSAMARSLNASIFTLMGIIGTVLLGAASFFVFLAKRAASVAQAEQSAGSPSQPEA
ncbi:MAG: hypothetical protein ABSH38_12210 [Verrucomicrobiota bacterium]|jgi:heme/copper-type cytochrome/quinol oxidase subunit 2